MEKLRIHVCGTNVEVVELGKLTTGMVGATASFSFSPEWNGLLKTAVFMVSGVTKDVILTDSTVQIPPECLTKPISLYVGVYGHLEDGTIVIPTVMSKAIPVSKGAKPSGDTSTNPTLPVWAQILGMIGDISHLTTEDQSSLVAAVNELAARGGGGVVDEAEVRKIVEDVLNERTYNGSYSVTPSSESLTLETAAKFLDADIRVEKIPYAEVSNNSGGTTVTIGGN